MYKLIITLTIALMTVSLCWGWNKDDFDIQSPDTPAPLSKALAASSVGWTLNKELTGITLTHGGYFTFGTNSGLSITSLDDNCGLTFGHPFALTSYPIIFIDGQWQMPESVFDIYQNNPDGTGDSLKISYSLPDRIEFTFSLKPDDRGEIIAVTAQIENISSQSQSLATGLVFDAGIGRRGDGWLSLNSHDILNDTLLINSFIPRHLSLKERIGVVDGLKLNIDLVETYPYKLIIANWKNIYENPGSTLTLTELRKLYDLALEFLWDEQTLDPGEKMVTKAFFILEEPDFNSNAYLRWNLPQFLSIENNIVFPSEFSSLVEVQNLTSARMNNCQLQIDFPGELYSNVSAANLSVNANGVGYQQINIQSEDVYEDCIVDLNIALMQNSQILDSLFRRAYIPATPISDTGLVVSIDTVMADQFPDVRFAFHAEVEASHQRIKNLARKNIFLYENSERIETYEFGIDTAGGVTDIDIVFVLDCSGSMGDDIRAVKSNINEFCDSLIARGLNYRLGLVTFSTTVDAVHDFTDNVELFKSWLDVINLWGGRENSLGALYQATDLSFRPLSKRTFVWITDEDYPLSPEINLSVQEVVERLLLYGVTVHSICLPNLQTKWCNPIIDPTGGNFYDIGGNFRDILLDISQMRAVSRYLISYTSPNPTSGVNLIKLEIHYAGLGGSATAEYSHESLHALRSEKALKCYPNPFNPAVQIQVNSTGHASGTLDIYNILGQRVRTYSLRPNALKNVIVWDARNQFQQEVAAGTYFVQLNLFAKDGRQIHREITKVLHLK
ncbi:VWA domain-containing protein [candidate division KSB1 bacterium]|nr:VWA domain-containing protein [candidate division KSB1 bacterium]